MSLIAFTALLFMTSIAAGFLGALTGLGGGVVIVPVLTLLFKVDTATDFQRPLLKTYRTHSASKKTLFSTTQYHSRR